MEKTRRSILRLCAVAVPLALSAQTASPDISGKWEFVLDTEGGPRTRMADFKLDGKTVTGTWEKKPDVKGTFSEGKLDLEFPLDSEEVGQGTLKLNGKLGETLTGSWSFQTYSGTFKATRVKP